MDIAASIQVVLEEAVLRLTGHIAKETGMKNLCLAGGVALNCVANGKIQRQKDFHNICIQPAAGDAGGALRAALAAFHLYAEQSRSVTKSLDGMSGSYLGPEFTQQEIEVSLKAAGAHFTTVSRDAMFDLAAAALADDKAVGWFQKQI